MVIALNKLFLRINKQKKKKKLNMIGQKILVKTIKEIKISTKMKFKNQNFGILKRKRLFLIYFYLHNSIIINNHFLNKIKISSEN